MLRLLLPFILIPVVSYSQTCVIGKIYDKGIVVGADTKLTLRTVSSPLTISIESTPMTKIMKKIGGYKDTYFAVSGWDVENSYDLALQSCKDSLTVYKVEMDFRDKKISSLTSLFSSMYLVNSSEYRKYVGSKGIAEIIFFGYENDSAIIIKENFGLSSNSFFLPEITCDITEYRYSLIPQESTVGLAHYEAVQPYMYEEGWWTKDPQLRIYNLIKLQIRDTPEIVGLPIDVIVITRKRKRLKIKEYRYNE